MFKMLSIMEELMGNRFAIASKTATVYRFKDQLKLRFMTDDLMKAADDARYIKPLMRMDLVDGKWRITQITHEASERMAKEGINYHLYQKEEDQA